MNMKKTFLITTAVTLLVFAVAIGIRQPQSVNAQDQIPPPVPDRVSFGTVGITSGQSLRVGVTNTIMPNDINLPPGPIRTSITFRLPNGSLARDSRTGEVIRRIADVGRGDTVFLDLDYGDLPPSPIRAQLRPVVVVQPPPVADSTQMPYPRDAVVPIVEVVNNANGRTQFAVYTHPAVARGFNPQPDPPSPE
jgi:hypothetical protein